MDAGDSQGFQGCGPHSTPKQIQTNAIPVDPDSRKLLPIAIITAIFTRRRSAETAQSKLPHVIISPTASRNPTQSTTTHGKHPKSTSISTSSTTATSLGQLVHLFLINLW
ncbi:hypothetical protein VTJ04DRAFT_7151 [Mycothermus thermophilus]|uniref:uncharacterized protein n=1 Tax=Humicola insolens TaxID=85995 RepID=UPI003742CFB4